MICYYIAKVVDHSIVVIEMFLVCNVIKQDYLIKSSGDYNDMRPSR